MTNTNLIERLRYFTANGDHERGCQGREYSCTCQFDDNAVVAVNEAAALIEQQEALLANLADALDDMTKHYVEVRNDLFGFEAEEEIEVIASRGLILAAKTYLEE